MSLNAIILSYPWPRRTISSALHFLKQLNIISARGWALLVFLLYLLLGPVFTQSDIIAAVLCYGLLALFLLLVSITLVKGLALKHSLKIKITPQLSRTGSRNQIQHCSVILSTSPHNLPAFFIANLQLRFARPGIRSAIHILSGKSKEPLRLQELIAFPHRGLWQISHCQVSFSDRFGLSSLRWTIQDPAPLATVKVRPIIRRSPELPILSSSQRSGEISADNRERAGEPYDLKRYNPADGTKRILWKVYAKTGNLLSRHPESSVTPEGQTLAFIFAGKNDDQLCGAALAYLHLLEELELEVFCGCLGMGRRLIASSALTTEQLLIETVWAAEQASIKSALQELAHTIQSFTRHQHQTQLKKVLLFCSAKNLQQPLTLEILVRLADYLNSIQLEPVFCLEQLRSTDTNESSSGLLSVLEEYFMWQKSNKPRQNLAETELEKRLFQICASKRWQVIVF